MWASTQKKPSLGLLVLFSQFLLRWAPMEYIRRGGEIQCKLIHPSFPWNMEKQQRASPWELGLSASRKARFITQFLMVNSLIREFILPMPLLEGCAVSSLSDISYGNVMDSPLQGMPPEELSLIKEAVALMSPWLKAAHVHSKRLYCCSSATFSSF